MRIFTLAAALCLATPGMALAQAGTAAHYSVAQTEIGVLLDDPAARAVLDKHVPDMTKDEQVEMARAMTMKDIQQYSPDILTDKLLAEIDADLAKIPAK